MQARSYKYISKICLVLQREAKLLPWGRWGGREQGIGQVRAVTTAGKDHCWPAEAIVSHSPISCGSLAVSGQVKEIWGTELIYVGRDCCCNSHCPVPMREKALGSTESFCRPSQPAQCYLNCSCFQYYLPQRAVWVACPHSLSWLISKENRSVETEAVCGLSKWQPLPDFMARYFRSNVWALHEKQQEHQNWLVLSKEVFS